LTDSTSIPPLSDAQYSNTDEALWFERCDTEVCRVYATRKSQTTQ
jgi:hypothetical protein